MQHGRGGQARIEAQTRHIVDLDLVVSDPRREAKPALASAAVRGGGAALAGPAESGGVSASAYAPAAPDAGEALPTRLDPGDLVTLAPPWVTGPAKGASSPSPSLVGGGMGSGQSRGIGSGDGTGPGKGPRRAFKRAELAVLAATLQVLAEADYEIVRREELHYTLGPFDAMGGLRGQVVRVKVLVDAEGKPLFMEAVGGPPTLYPAILKAMRGYRFKLSAKAKAAAPVLVVVRFLPYNGRPGGK